MARGKLFMGRERQSGVLRMVRWNFDIPPDAARDFVADMLSYHAEKDGHRRDQIAARQARLLNDHLPSKSKRMTPRDVTEVFKLMKAERTATLSNSWRAAGEASASAGHETLRVGAERVPTKKRSIDLDTFWAELDALGAKDFLPHGIPAASGD